MEVNRVRTGKLLTWDGCGLSWWFAVLMGLAMVGTPFKFCQDKNHYTVRRRMC